MGNNQTKSKQGPINLFHFSFDRQLEFSINLWLGTGRTLISFNGYGCKSTSLLVYVTF